MTVACRPTRASLPEHRNACRPKMKMSGFCQIQVSGSAEGDSEPTFLFWFDNAGDKPLQCGDVVSMAGDRLNFPRRRAHGHAFPDVDVGHHGDVMGHPRQSGEHFECRIRSGSIPCAGAHERMGTIPPLMIALGIG